MEATPTFLDYTDIMEVFMQVDGVVRVHNLRLWSLSVNKNALSAHLAIGNYICFNSTFSYVFFCNCFMFFALESFIFILHMTPTYTHNNSLLFINDIIIVCDNFSFKQRKKVVIAFIFVLKIIYKLSSGPDANPEEVLTRANATIQKKYEFFETTLQIERFQQDMEHCKQCLGPPK